MLTQTRIQLPQIWTSSQLFWPYRNINHYRKINSQVGKQLFILGGSYYDKETFTPAGKQLHLQRNIYSHWETVTPIAKHLFRQGNLHSYWETFTQMLEKQATGNKFDGYSRPFRNSITGKNYKNKGK